MARIAPTVLIALFLAATASTSRAQDSKKAKIDNALSAAPADLAKGATVLDSDMSVLRQGNNGWTCLPDNPNTPGNDPVCLDAQWLKLGQAMASKTKPEITGVGISYMLQGSTDASNTDPFATEPKRGEDWVRGGPHIMIIVPDPALLEGIPTDPYNGGPWVMWKGTPYAHIMAPISGPKM